MLWLSKPVLLVESKTLIEFGSIVFLLVIINGKYFNSVDYTQKVRIVHRVEALEFVGEFSYRKIGSFLKICHVVHHESEKWAIEELQSQKLSDVRAFPFGMLLLFGLRLNDVSDGCLRAKGLVYLAVF